MEYPVLDGKENIGVVSVWEEGLYRVVSASVRPRPGLQRLWLCGGGQGVCLGVLTPEAGALRLKKRLSRADWAALPRPLSHAALAAPAAEATPEPICAPAPDLAPAPQPSRETSIHLFGQRFVVFRS